MHARTDAPRIFIEFKTHVERLLDIKINVFNLIGVENIKKYTTLSSAPWVLPIASHVLTHTSKTAWPNGNIDIL
jgi:hypothetical protein